MIMTGATPPESQCTPVCPTGDLTGASLTGDS